MNVCPPVVKHGWHVEISKISKNRGFNRKNHLHIKCGFFESYVRLPESKWESQGYYDLWDPVHPRRVQGGVHGGICLVIIDIFIIYIYMYTYIYNIYIYHIYIYIIYIYISYIYVSYIYISYIYVSYRYIYIYHIYIYLYHIYIYIYM